MAKIQNNDKINKDEKVDVIESNEIVKNENAQEQAEQPIPVISTAPSVDQLMEIVAALSQEVKILRSQVAQGNVSQNIPNAIMAQSNKDMEVTNQLLSALMNRKSDKEVTLVHNRHCYGGLATHIELTGITIDFKYIGERRAISWQQFEECVSKYYNFFYREVILLADEHSDLAEQYHVKCVKREGQITITKNDLETIGTWSMDKVVDYVNHLSDNDKKFLISYWLGQCYQNPQESNGFYVRHKIETLNNLIEGRPFDNFLVYMNGMSVPERRKTETIKTDTTQVI